MRLSLIVVLTIIFTTAAVGYFTLPGTRQAGIFDVTPPTPYYRYSNGNSTHGRVLVVHGLGGNKDMLNLLCYGLADAGIEVFSIDLAGHGKSTEHFDAFAARQTVVQVLDRLGSGTNVLGHSFGATLLLDVAADRRFDKMVLFSPAPTPVLRVLANHILLLDGEHDLPPIRKFVPELADEAGNAEVQEVAGASHTDAVSEEPVIERVAAWFGGIPVSGNTSKRSWLLEIMLASSLGIGVALLEGAKQSQDEVAPAVFNRNVVLWYIGAAVAAALLTSVVNVTRWLHLFASDYLIAFVFVAGGILCLRRVGVRADLRSLKIAVVSAAYLIAIPGSIPLAELMHMTPTGGRIWRFTAIAALSVPLFLADEVLLRPVRPRWKAIFAMLLTRCLLGGIVATAAALFWSRDSRFLVLMVDSVIYFWIGLWFAGWFIYRRTHNPLATAIFMSLLQGWFFAVLFVTT